MTGTPVSMPAVRTTEHVAELTPGNNDRLQFDRYRHRQSTPLGPGQNKWNSLLTRGCQPRVQTGIVAEKAINYPDQLGPTSLTHYKSYTSQQAWWSFSGRQMPNKVAACSRRNSVGASGFSC